MTPRILKNVRIVDPSTLMDETGDILIDGGRIIACGAQLSGAEIPADCEIEDCTGLIAVPGLVDACVHIGEPGAEHRETIASASRAAAKGGVTSMIMMPDTDPVIDDVALVDFVQRLARDEAIVRVHPAAALTKGLNGEDMTEFGLLLDAGAVMLSNGRHTVDNPAVMRRVMTYARDFGAVVAVATQDRRLGGSGVMNEGLFASWLGLPGIPREAEIIPLERDLRLAALTGARYHAMSISVPESSDVIRAAKARGVDVTAGISINHLTLNETDIGEYRTFFRLSPPLRTEDDRRAMVSALTDGTIDIIVSAHDPQDVDTKRLPFADAENGAIGLETLLAAALRLYHSGDVPLMRLIDALSTRPARILGLDAGTLAIGARADIALIDPEHPWVLSKEDIVSRSKNSAFEDARFTGKVLQTLVAGVTVYRS
ncbi:dihydroorotase [Hoeflea sp. YIM 152468]|uniref:dihydroorotase n=1 Tax=Hoeflea sp. YIM 152468 TaxID=3031759 RepID=UPI0023DB8C9D|nr:dihydroorotase [Hoeflea sp. YIM 152468]MDF1607085.1 dihydroorotase [Hoeflea sp. YIM 152468]